MRRSEMIKTKLSIVILVALLSCEQKTKIVNLEEFLCDGDSSLYQVNKQTSNGFSKSSSKIFPYFFYKFYKNHKVYALIKSNSEFKKIEDSNDDVIYNDEWSISKDSILSINISHYKIKSIINNEITLVLLNDLPVKDTLVIEKIAH